MNTQEKEHKVCFHTNGPMDPISWEMMGISAKECDNPVGKWGTGLKYAISILLRNDHKVSIHSNNTVYEFALEDFSFRGKDFKRITCNGKVLPFTTEYGKKWPLWAAYRELVSNTDDEGGLVFPGDKQDEGTSIVIEGAEFRECLNNHEDCFIGNREPILSTSALKFYRGDGAIYFKGVKIGEVPDSAYSYELTHVDITEDRTIKNHWQVGYRIETEVCQLDDEAFIHEWLNSPASGYEKTLSLDYAWSDAFTKVIMNIWKEAPTTLPAEWVKTIRKKAPDAGWEPLEMSEDREIDLVAAKDFLEKAGYPVEAQIQLIQNKDDNNIAFMSKGKIYLTSRAFDKGLFYLVRVLFEESAHTKGMDDYSHQFQEYLIEQLLVQTKKRLRIAL